MLRLEDNSYATRSERDRNREPLEKVTTGTVTKKKKTVGRKILDTFLSEKLDDVGDYIRYNIFGPGVKSLIYDVVMSTFSMMFWGDANVGRGRDSRGGSGRRAYDRAYDDRRSGRDVRDSRARRPAYDYDDIFFETREDAERVLDRLYEQLDRYGKARVADLYEAAGISAEGNYTVNYYGWYSLRGSGTYPTSEGWALELPRCESIR